MMTIAIRDRFLAGYRRWFCRVAWPMGDLAYSRLQDREAIRLRRLRIETTETWLTLRDRRDRKPGRRDR